MKPRHAELTRRQLKALTILLGIQFILGVILTTLIDYNPNKSSAVQTTFLVLHIVAAVGLLISAFVRVITAVIWRFLEIHSLIGLLAIIDALVAGIVAASNGSGVAVFLMAMGFLIAFGAYGYSLSAVNRLMVKQQLRS